MTKIKLIKRVAKIKATIIIVLQVFSFLVSDSEVQKYATIIARSFKTTLNDNQKQSDEK